MIARPVGCRHAHLKLYLDAGNLVYACEDCGKTFATRDDAEADAKDGGERP